MWVCDEKRGDLIHFIRDRKGVEPHVAGLSELRPEVSEEHGAVDMLCTLAREVTYVRGSIPTDSLDCRRHVGCYLLAYREWRPKGMEGALSPLFPVATSRQRPLGFIGEPSFEITGKVTGVPRHFPRTRCCRYDRGR
jgi:hypothetical protein